MDKLEPCPLCGSTESMMDNYSLRAPRFARECADCCYATATYETREEVDAAWNTRPQPSPAQSEVEAVAREYEYAANLLRSLFAKHFPEREPLNILPDTLGVLTQLDNLSTALVRARTGPDAGRADGEGFDLAVGAIRAWAVGFYDKLARSHPSLERGQVWCRHCGHSQRVDSADCLRTGWPKHCGYTMTIDHPDTWSRP